MPTKIAARLKAFFHSRSSNIGVAPLDALRVDPGCHFVVYRARPPCEFLGPDTLPTLLPDEHNLVPNLYSFVHREDASVHRHPAQNRATRPTYKRRRLAREYAMVPLSVPYRHRRRERGLSGLERQPVGDPLAGQKAPDVRHIAIQDECRLQVLVERVAFVPCRMQTVEGYTGAD